MKSIRIQIDMLYQVNDKNLEEVLEHDSNFFNTIEKQFNNWGKIPTEKRIPVNFEIRTHVGDVKETDKTDDPKDGVNSIED